VPENAASLLERPLYGMAQVDDLLGLKHGTARRWINGYERAGRRYPPLVRLEPTGNDVVTWGEFVETRLLAEYRKAGIRIFHMRAAIERLRDQFNRAYPLAFSHQFLTVDGQELLLRVQEEVGLEQELCFVVVRNGQTVLREPAKRFWDSADVEAESGIVTRIRPLTGVQAVAIDPLHSFGEPSVRNVPTAIVYEQFRAGESVDGIAEQFDLAQSMVEAALRYELERSRSLEAAA